MQWNSVSVNEFEHFRVFSIKVDGGGFAITLQVNFQTWLFWLVYYTFLNDDGVWTPRISNCCNI